ncbi:MAG: hypothetical protein EBY16_08570 [Gammaproteobacteria bacterium]|nr:hypothetical protein [Gammaproteobacteria bacterium]
MTEIFADEEKVTPVEDDILELEKDADWQDFKASQDTDARRRLEDLLDEKRLKKDLDDYFELQDL